MTAQVSDTVDVDGVRYAICGLSGFGLFDPAAHGVAPRPTSTACWRGYVCHYAVADGSLRLAELRLGAGSEVGGAQLAPGTTLLGAPGEQVRGEYAFRWEALDVAFTGTVLAGEGFVRSTYVHMGYTPAWKYEHVLRLTIEAGRVTEREDISESMAATRESVMTGERPDPDGDRADVNGWILRTFRLGLDRSPEPPPPVPPTR